MRAVIQRVQHASVSVDGTVRGAIGKGYLVLLRPCSVTGTASTTAAISSFSSAT